MSMKKILTSIAVITTTATLAQDTGSRTLEQVIVTANKFPQKQNTTGKVITVITKDQIEKSSGKTVAQLLNEQVGITINGAYNNAGSVQTVFMRGASSGRTLILLDGIPVNDPSMINNEFDLNLFSLSQVEQIEICRGAQSTLYGSDAIAGVINIITVNPNVKKPFNLKTTQSFGSLNTYKGNVQLYGKEKKLTYSARYAKLKTDGFSAANGKQNNYLFDKDGYNGDVVNAQLLYQLTKTLSLKSFGMFSKYKADIDRGTFADDKDYTINNDLLTTGVGFSFKKNFLQVNGNYQFNQNNRRYLNDTILDKGTFEDNKYFGKTQFAELYANTNLGKGFNLLTGIDYRYWAFNQHYFSKSSFGPFSSQFQDTSLNQTAVYASLNYRGLNDRLYLELGSRWNKHSRYGSNYTYTFNPSLKLTEDFRIFGSISSGFKAPSIYQLLDKFSGNTDLKAEKSTNYEAGIQYQDHIVNAKLIYFNRNIDNGIDYNYITFKYFNYVNQKVQGAEFEFMLKPVDQVIINLNYTYLDPKERSQNRITNKDTITYSYLLRRPNHMINATVGVTPCDKTYFSIGGKFVGTRYDVGGFKKADVRLNDYFILNAYAEYKAKKWLKFFVDAQNIGNENFYDINGYNAIPFIVNGGFSINL
jgi:vitamin B12 transporter